jgi:hypothetical protein
MNVRMGELLLVKLLEGILVKSAGKQNSILILPLQGFVSLARRKQVVARNA